MKKKLNIAIDGPSGAGKSTLAKAVAKELGIIYVDTGAMYRAVGLYAAQHDIAPDDENTISAHFPNIKIELKWEQGSQRIFLCGADVSDSIRTPKASMYASAVSALPAVRTFLLDTQRSLARENSVIMDGRDIGTVILPDADVKIFMVTDPDVRAERRYKELIEKGMDVTLQQVKDDMQKRDTNDSTRKTAPCVPADDAIMFDNTNIGIEESVVKVIEIVKEKIGNVL